MSVKLFRMLDLVTVALVVNLVSALARPVVTEGVFVSIRCRYFPTAGDESSPAVQVRECSNCD